MRTPNLRVYAERMKAWEGAFREFVEVLCRNGNVLEVYLSGSRARGNSLPYSDYDVVVIVREARDPVEEAVRLRRLRRRSFPLDLLVLTPSEARDPLYRGMLEGAVRLCGKA
ncbi:nucleotidyltransferase domain-containing protein [Stetteria hydrogenophila]